MADPAGGGGVAVVGTAHGAVLDGGGDVRHCTGSRLLVDVWREELPEERPHTLQRVAMLCTGLWPDALAGEGVREAAARALVAHHEAETQGGAT